MNMISPRKLRSASAYSCPSHVSAPGFSRYSLMVHVTGSAMMSTKLTAIPSPNAVFTFFDTARNEHMPRK